MSTRGVTDCDSCGQPAADPAVVVFGAVKLDLCGPCAADAIHDALPHLSPEQRERWFERRIGRGVAMPMPGHEPELGGSD